MTHTTKPLHYVDFPYIVRATENKAVGFPRKELFYSVGDCQAVCSWLNGRDKPLSAMKDRKDDYWDPMYRGPMRALPPPY